MIWRVFKGRPSVADSASRGVRHQITVNSQNLRKYAGNNQTSGIHGTLAEITCKRGKDKR